MLKVKFSILLVIFACAFAQAASIDDTITICNDCHGAKGVSSDSDIPIIAGYSETTIIDMLAAYIDETRIAQKS